MPPAHRSTLLPLEPAARRLAHLRALPGATARRLCAGDPLGLSAPEPGGAGRLRVGGEPFLVVEAGAVLLRGTDPAGHALVLDTPGPGDLVRWGWSPHGGAWGDLPCPDDDGWEVGIQARALAPSRVLAVPGSVLRAALERDPGLGACVADLLNRQVHRMHRALARSLIHRVEDRLVALLVDLAAAHGRPVRGGAVLELPLTQELLAEMVAATRETVNRALRRLSARRAIAMAGRSIIILDQKDRPS